MNKQARVGLVLGALCIGVALAADWAVRMLTSPEAK